LTDYVTKQREELRGQAIEPIIAAGLDMLFTDLLGRVWQKQDGTTISLTQILVDTGYLPEIVKGAIQRVGLSPSALPLIMPSKGLAETVTKAWPKFDRKKGDVWGDYWGAKAPAIGEQRLVLVETNYWKSFLHQRLFAGIGARGSFSLYKADPTEHAMLADHLTSERASLIVDKSGQREKVQFMEPPNAKNHLLDCLVGCHVAASMRGCKLTDAQPRQQQRKKSNFSWKKAMGAA
jgi:phage terminase large subunit GpA-like protein